MPNNPDRSDRGGDVTGETSTDVGLGLPFRKLNVSKASYDAGFPVGHVCDKGGDDITLAEIKVGYTSYGVRKVGQ